MLIDLNWHAKIWENPKSNGALFWGGGVGGSDVTAVVQNQAET
jgi:hypothetical protein